MAITSALPFYLNLVTETTVYQNEIKCRVQENEFNITQNPTALNYDPAVPYGTLADNVTGSDFRPYATTIGLYNAANELLVVGKLATPCPIPSNTDIVFIVRWDS